MKKIIVLSFIACALFLVSCNNKKEETIVFDNSHPLALAPDVSWAVVIDPYAAYKSEPEWHSEVSGHCRKGEILQIKGKSLDNKSDVWYSFEQGWLPANCLSIYNNRYKAKTAAEQLGE